MVLGDKSVLTNSNLGGQGIFFSDYYAKDFVVTNADIEDQRIGVNVSPFVEDTFTIEHCRLVNSTNILVTTLGAAGSSPDGHTMTARQVIINDDLFAPVTGYTGGVPYYDIDLEYGEASGSANLVQNDTVLVYNYNQVAGDNFQVYYYQQAADFIVPQSSGNLVGSPVAGLTNAQNWQQYGIAIAGAVCPTSQTRSNIHGYVRPF